MQIIRSPIISKLGPEDITIMPIPAYRGNLFSREWKKDKAFPVLAINVPAKFISTSTSEEQKFIPKELYEIRDYILKIFKEEFQPEDIWYKTHMYDNIRKNAIPVPNDTYKNMVYTLDTLEDDFPEIHRKILYKIAEKSEQAII